jgi:glycosyltransferase involved in cell wall biosynthesis
MRIAFLTPLPPARTGIAHYASMLLPALAQRMEVTAVATAGEVRDDLPYRVIPFADYRRGDFDSVLYQLGNNPFHEAIYREALSYPGVAVLHDAILHHLIVEMTLARGDAEAYIDAMGRSHGEAGRAWATARAQGLHGEIGNFLFPASVEVANRSRAVIVHNQYAADWLRRGGVTSPIHVVPHPFVGEGERGAREVTRATLGFTKDHRVIGLFGFLTSAKRGEVVLEAFRRAQEANPNLRLLIVGEAAPNIDITSIEGSGVVTTGYVNDDEFDAYYEACDRFVNLRYPSAGETSGTLIRALAAGKPVAVSDYAQFSEFPHTCVTRVAFGPQEIDELARFMTADFDVATIATAQHAWLEQNATLDLAVAGYAVALESCSSAPSLSPVSRALPLFPQLEVRSLHSMSGAIRLTLRNTGDITLLARTYGQPGYRLIAKLYDAHGESANRWLQLDGDLAPGGETALRWTPPVPNGRFVLTLHHAAEGLPLVDAPEWFRAEVKIV